MSLIVMCGLPGSGKTSYVQKYYSSKGEAIVSLDSIRYELFGDSRSQQDNRLVMLHAVDRVEHLLLTSKTVVFDATSMLISYRDKVLRIARQLNIPSIIVYKKVQLEDILMINKYRDNPVPERAIINMRLKMEEPSVGEADNLIIV